MLGYNSSATNTYQILDTGDVRNTNNSYGAISDAKLKEMTVTVKVLIPAKTAEGSQTTQYTATNVTTIIDKFTATNYSATAATLSVNLVTAADTAGNQNLITKTKTLAGQRGVHFPRDCRPGADGKRVYLHHCWTCNEAINIRASGREVS
jgi:hypothetical protein